MKQIREGVTWVRLSRLMYLLDMSEEAIRHWQRSNEDFPKPVTKDWFPEDHLTLYNVKEIKAWLLKNKKNKHYKREMRKP